MFTAIGSYISITSQVFAGVVLIAPEIQWIVIHFSPIEMATLWAIYIIYIVFVSGQVTLPRHVYWNRLQWFPGSLLPLCFQGDLQRAA